jgi:hypothetical protein
MLLIYLNFLKPEHRYMVAVVVDYVAVQVLEEQSGRSEKIEKN